GYIKPDMGDTAEAKDSRDAAYDRITGVLGTLRKMGRLDWDTVLDLTRELDEWQTYGSPREARAALRERYDEDRRLGQPYFPIFVFVIRVILLAPNGRWSSPWVLPASTRRHP